MSNTLKIEINIDTKEIIADFENLNTSDLSLRKLYAMVDSIQTFMTNGNGDDTTLRFHNFEERTWRF
jgi:hypothetical protein